MFTLIRKGTASFFNMALVEGLTRPLDNFVATSLIFFLYSFGTDVAMGRCLGMMIAGSQWIGEPTWKQKLVYSASYSLCFSLLFVSPWMILLVGGAQVLAILLTGKTTHGLLARMDSESLRKS